MIVLTSSRHLDLLEEQLARKDARIAELERQVDELHRQGYTITAPTPAAEVAPIAFDSELRDLLDGLTDDDARRAWTADAERRIAAGEDQRAIARTLFR